MRDDQSSIAPASSPPSTTAASHSGKRSGVFEWMRQWLLRNTFTPSWLPPGWQNPLIGFLAAILVAWGSVVITGLLIAAFPSFPFPGVPMILGVILVAITWGAAPSFVATLLSALLLNFLVLDPLLNWHIETLQDVISMLVFLAIGCAISIIASQTERARREAEYARQQAEELAGQLDGTFNAIVDGFAVYDRQGRIVRTNAAMKAMLDIDHEPRYEQMPLAERNSLLSLADEYGQLLPEDRWPQWRVLHGEVLSGANETLALRTPAGRHILISVSGTPIRNSRGRITGAVIISRDVTERAQLERRTRESLNALLAMAEALVTPSTDTSAQVAAPPETAGEVELVTAAEGHERPSVTYARSETATRMTELTRSVLGCQRVGIVAIEPGTGALLPVAVTGLTPQQEALWWSRRHNAVEYYSSLLDESVRDRLVAGDALILDMTEPPYNAQTNLFGITKILFAPMRIEDHLIGVLSLDYGGDAHHFSREEVALTEGIAKLAALVIERERLLRERAEAQANELALREANQRMDEFLSIASHEIRTPITPIKGNTQLALRLLAHHRDQPNAERWLDRIENLLERNELLMGRLDRLVNDLLDVSRMTSGKLELRPRLIDLTALVRESAEELRIAFSERTIELEIPEQPAMVYADPDRINQVLTNFLTNALKYSPETMAVTVAMRIEQENERAEVQVRDHGPGLSAEQQAHIWERFYRAPGIEVQSGSGVGLGLGLYISRSLIERQSGTVQVTSVPGEGSTFSFTLPLATDAPGSACNDESDRAP